MITISYVDLFLIVLAARFAYDIIKHGIRAFCKWQDPARPR